MEKSFSMSSNEVSKWNEKFSKRPIQDVLKFAIDTFGSKLTLACSLSLEDCLLLHELVQISKEISVFVLDTGRMHETSYQTLDTCRVRYGANIQVYFPNTNQVEHLLQTKGAFSFYESLENRKECCHIRKVEPLKRALNGKDAWITGLRKEQALTRANLEIFEMDTNNATSPNHALIKINPLIHWSWEQILLYAKEKKVVTHPLHNQAYPSIGCEPCTRAVQKGEDLRSGRWWWEDAKSKECGLHLK